MSKKWTHYDLFWIHTGTFDVKYLKLPVNVSVKLLKKTVLRSRSEEAIRKKLRQELNG